jgi:hypothetical protein
MRKYLLSALPLVLVLPFQVSAESAFIYEAPVVKATEIIVQKRIHEKPAMCYSTKPGNFARLLAWDLTCERPRVIEATAWEVTYALEGAHFTTRVDQAPGATINVRIGMTGT